MANLPSLPRYFLKPECRSSRVLCARSGALLSYLTLPLFEFTTIFHVPLPALLLPRPIVMLPSLYTQMMIEVCDSRYGLRLRGHSFKTVISKLSF
jgi:hypothetical protein